MSEQCPTVSVIIPCYNQGEYLDEAVDSILAQTYQDFEIIIVNDGSTEAKTQEILESYNRPQTQVIHIENQGVAAARNLGIKAARGKYILPLDADDKIGTTYLEEGVKRLEADDNLGIVYCEAEFFGEKVGKWQLLEYKFPDILLNNQIFCSALFRKSDWEKVGGYKSEMVYGWEDYEFWLSLLELGRKVEKIPDTLFFYRQKNISKTTELNVNKIIYSYQKLYQFHRDLYGENIQAVFSEIVNLRESIEDLKSQREKGRKVIRDLDKELRRTQKDFFAARDKIEWMESSKFWKLRNYYFKLKNLIRKRLDILFKLKRVTKKFLFVVSEEGLGIALWRSQRKILKKIVKVITGKELFQADLEVLQDSHLESPQPIHLPTSTEPVVSIIIPVYNKFVYTFNCLNSLRKRINKNLQYEVIVIDDCSSDETQESLSSITGITVLRNEENLGFIRSCNQGATIAKGKYVYFLNNDTQILKECVEKLLETIENEPLVGAVGSKLIYPDGRLQEAGGIIWKEASGWNYGRLQNPNEPEYNYLRPVDYCSGASLLVRADLFNQLGGFSEEFLPAYYEDTDLCFAIRKLGYKVMYQPKSRLIHYEGITSGTSLSSGIKQYQEINCTKFREKWQEELEKHFSNNPEKVPQAARRLQEKPTILVIDSYVPLYDRESGCVRLLGILKILKDLGYSIIFMPDNANPEEPYTSRLQEMGIEVLYYTPTQVDIEEQLIKRLPFVDVVWLCRPELCEKYLDVIRHYADVPIIYDTIDLHFLRLKRQQEFLPQAQQNTTWSWETYQKQETKFAKETEATVVVTPVEKQTLNDLGIHKVWVIPNIHHLYQGAFKDFEQRHGLVFIGSYNHPPNIDAVIWLCKEIMPIIWQTNPDITITLLGSNLKDEVKALENERVIVTGYVEDVSPYFLESRLFVAPLRFGAGMKGKIGHSMSYGLPTVTTAIGAEGMGLKDGYDVIIADEAELFAAKVIQVYENTELWQHLSENALKTIQQYSPASVQQQLKQLLDTVQNQSCEL